MKVKFALGLTEKERLEITVMGYACETYDNEYDANWLNASTSIVADGFKGRITLMILAPELSLFASGISKLYEQLDGEAEFKTMEDQLYIKCRGDGLGHIAVTGYIRDAIGTVYNTLNYELALDQTQLKRTINELDKVLKEYPERKV
jgi:hypothetical protein